MHMLEQKFFHVFFGGPNIATPTAQHNVHIQLKIYYFHCHFNITRLTVDRVKPLLTSNYTDYVPKMLYNDPK